ncbi:class I SAM-dependent methyltransferase [Azospira restricta]|uniref:Methyltransferase domain-containing protein n=1 Tax=Azospira restricta TaxID=404405 RepID=A0A974PY75_9RHOO|nr:methyltransferase domain-containing protein [Azospira restricta]QRJ63600.1 methyltransferase domain-containing protein [Azospira restricta]
MADRIHSRTLLRQRHPLTSSQVSTDTIAVWGFRLPAHLLGASDRKYLASLPLELPSIEWLWSEMDRIWVAYGLNNKVPDQPLLQQYYSHPVWIANGVFTAQDPISASHRIAIAHYVGRLGTKEVADYGGGFGELARTISTHTEAARVAVIEPYVTAVAKALSAGNERISFLPSLDDERYDLIIAQDILEHVADPLGTTNALSRALKPGGFAIIANCFFPVIQCHLPATFHLRHTFRFVVPCLGLKYVGRVPGAEHAQIFVRSGAPDLAKLRNMERASQTLGPVLNALGDGWDALRRKLNR